MGYVLFVATIALAVIFLIAPLGMAALMSFDSRTFLGPPVCLSTGTPSSFPTSSTYEA